MAISAEIADRVWVYAFVSAGGSRLRSSREDSFVPLVAQRRLRHGMNLGLTFANLRPPVE
jgi:hypothetical protein